MTDPRAPLPRPGRDAGQDGAPPGPDRAPRTSGRSTHRSAAARAADILDRPDIVLSVVPAGALYVGLVQAQHSSGPGGRFGAVGLVLVSIFYLAQLVGLLVEPRLARSAPAAVILAASSFASMLFTWCLEASMSLLVWTWLLPPVLMISAYICTVRHLLLVGLATYTAGGVLLWTSGYDLRDHPVSGLFVLLAWGLPCLLTRLVLGSLRQEGEAVQERSSHDPLTGALNGIGLELGFADLVDRVRRDPDARLTVVAIGLDDLKRVGELQGNVAVGRILERAAEGLRRAYRRDHLVARVDGDSFVVVGHQPAEQLCAALAAEARRAGADLGLTTSTGAVRGIRAADVGPDQLSGLVLLAQGLLAQARTQARPQGGDALVLREHDQSRPLPGPVAVPLPDIGPLGPRPVIVGRTEEPLLGAGLSVLGVLAVLVPSSPQAPTAQHLALLLGAAALGVTGVLVSARWARSVPLVTAAVALADVVAVLSVWQASGPADALIAMTLVSFPAFLAALTLPMTPALVLSALLPVTTWAALQGAHVGRAMSNVLLLSVIGFGLTSCALALWVRRVRDLTHHRLLLLATTDAVTGLVSRQGLLERYRALESGLPIGVVYLDIDDMSSINARYGRHGGDMLLRRAAALLLDAAGPTGIAARVGGDEFVLVLPGQARASGAVARLTELLTSEEIPLSMSSGQAFGQVEGDGTLWRLLASADEALLLNRARDRHTHRRSAHPATY